MSVSVAQLSKFQFNWNNAPIVGGLLFTYASGTTTKLTTYQDSFGAVPNTNPIVLDANGQCNLYLTDGLSYKFVVSPPGDTDPPTNPYWTQDNILSAAGAAGVISASIVSEGPFESGTDFTPGTTTTLTLSQAYGVPQNISVHFDGVYQGPDQYTLSGKDIVFNSPIPVGTNTVYIIGGVVVGTGVEFVTPAQLASESPPTGASLVGFLQNGTGAVGRTLQSKETDTISVIDFGAGTGVADNAIALNAALGASAIGNGIHIPTGAYTFDSVLNLVAPGRYFGDGFYAALTPGSGFSGNNLHIAPSLSVAFYAATLEKFTIGNPANGTRNGVHGVYLDTTVAGSNASKFSLRNMSILSGSGNAFYAQNDPANNPNGGTYGLSLENNLLYGGISLFSTGDSNTVHKNIITGENTGVYASNVTGASMLTVQDNNITTTGGAIQIDAGSRFKILRNNCEQNTTFTPGPVGTNSYMVTISGNNGTMSTPEIRGNHFGLFSGVPNSGVIYVNNTIGALISENTILNSNASAVGIVIGTATNTRVGPNTYGSGVVTKVVDNGTGTMGVIKSMTLQNSWSNLSNSPASFYKDILGTVHLMGGITGGTVTSGTIIATLPAGFLPTNYCRFPAMSSNGSALVAAEIDVDLSGNIKIIYGTNAILSLDGINFPALGLADSVSDL